MKIEVEVKYPGVNLDAVRVRLEQAEAVSAGIFLERNVVFDTPERALLSAGCLLRVRECEGAGHNGGLFTFKRPAAGDRISGYKRQEERETRLTNPQTMHTVLAMLGYPEAFAYDKVREIYHWREVEVCLDLLPFGDEEDGAYPVVELEGEEGDIERAVQMLGLPASLVSVNNYHELNKQWRSDKNLPPRDSFVFSESWLVKIREELRRMTTARG